MPTLNIDVNARTEKAKRDLRALDKEILKISKSEVILERALKKVGDVGPVAFRKIQTAAVRQAKAVNSSALQFKQLRAQMSRLGTDPQIIGRVTSEFIRFRREMERGVVGTTRFQRAQDRLKTSLSTTKRQMASTVAATRRVGTSAVKGGKGIAGLSTNLENLGSTAVLVAGPLSGIGSRLIAFGAIAKRGSLLAAGLFSAIAAGSVFVFKSIMAFDELNLSLAKTEAVLKATGKEAQITSKFVEEVASKIARSTLANLEDTRPVATSLLSFKGVGTENLEELLALAQDMAALGTTDLANAAKLLGRVLEDPIANFNALRRVFVQLTPLQKDQVTHLQNIGKGAEAAGIIFDILKEKLGGVGVSQNTGLSGALDNLGQSWKLLLEDMGKGAAYNLAVDAINSLADAFDRLIEIRAKLRGMVSNVVSGIKDTNSEFRNRLKSMDSDSGGAFISMDPDTKRTIDEMRKGEIGKGDSLGDMIVKKTVSGAISGVESLASSFKKGTEDLIDNFVRGSNIINSRLFGIGGPTTPEESPKPKEKLVIDINTPRGPETEVPSHFEKALIDANIGIERSFMDLNLEREKLQNGFTLLSPEILRLAQKHKVLDEVVRALAGDFDGMGDAGRKIFTLAVKVNESFKDLGRRTEATVIIDNTRTALEKYNDELRRQIFLYDNNYIKLSNLIVKQKELRSTLESSTPELNALTSASEKFGDSLADLVVKGEGFADGLRSIFKTLVDDITKQFFKLSVINPILNGIFGASSDRPGLGSQGGGKYGLGGSGGLFGMLMGDSANDNSPQKALEEVSTGFEEAGRKEVDRYGEALNKTNVKMEEAGTKAAGDFSNIFSDMATGMASAAGGVLGSIGGNLFADLLGFQHGGSFKVGGSGGRDSQLVAFKASPREKVSVETPGQQNRKGGGNVTYIDARGVDPGQMSRLIEVVKDLDESVEIRAVNAAADARDRNPSLFGRIS